MFEYIVRPLEILNVEDNDLDAEALERALGQIQIPKNLRRVEDGQAALDYLHRRGQYAEAPRPDVILLDLNMPGISGHEVLQHVKKDDDLKTIPVIILTTSGSLVDIKLAYANFANGFLTKPFKQEDTLDAVGALGKFWFSVVRLPPRADQSEPWQRGEAKAMLAHECPLEILYVEDDPLDGEMFVETANDLGFSGPIHVIDFAEDAMAILNQKGMFQGASSPDLVVLDINLPVRSGLDLLKQLRGERRDLQSMQTIVLTNFNSDEAVLEAYRSYANAFIPKPRTANEWKQTLAAISHWYAVVKRA